jgi:2'-5' RNA ligase
MKYFIGIIPPEQIYNEVLRIQQQHGDNRLEPHITLRPPVTPVDAARWIQVVEQVCASLEPFEVRLPGTGTFGKRVLFVTVASDQLIKLHDALIPDLRSFEPAVENGGREGFHPHMTLGRAWCGFSPDDFKSMQALAERYLADDVMFRATAVRIYYKPDPHGRYQTYKDVPFGLSSGKG